MIHRRAPASILAVALSAAVGLGCGAGDSTDGTSGASAEALARVSAADFARGVNLRASDVPYFEPQPDEGEEDPRQRHRQEQELLKCIGVKESDDSLADVESPTYGTESPGELLNVASSVEVVLGAEEAAATLRALGEDLEGLDRGSPAEAALKYMAATIACHAAVKANYPLTYEKMLHILSELAATSYSTICPHGRPVMLRLTRRELEKNFQRI